MKKSQPEADGLETFLAAVPSEELRAECAGGVTENSQRAFAAMMEMKKLDIASLKKAYDGA